MAKVIEKPLPAGQSSAEIEFKAEFFHRLWVERKVRDGKHYVSFHDNPMVTPPPLRGDGKTRCDDCLLTMAPYSMLSEALKDIDRDIVLNIPKAEAAWRNR